MAATYIQYLSFTACHSAALVHQSPVHVVLLVVYLHFRAVCFVCRQRSGSVQITMLAATLLLCSVALSGVRAEADATTTEPPPRPYAFSYTAGRYPGHTDRQHAEVSDGSGVVRGTFSYVDPAQHVRTVDYVADREGFHPVLSDPLPALPQDSEAVAAAKDRHLSLYARIAEEHATHPHPDESYVPRQSAAVSAAAARHASLFRVIAEQHARIAAERDALQQAEQLE